jgi:hypothetical protein
MFNLFASEMLTKGEPMSSILLRYRVFLIPEYSGTPSALHDRQPQLVN